MSRCSIPQQAGRYGSSRKGFSFCRSSRSGAAEERCWLDLRSTRFGRWRQLEPLLQLQGPPPSSASRSPSPIPLSAKKRRLLFPLSPAVHARSTVRALGTGDHALASFLAHASFSLAISCQRPRNFLANTHLCQVGSRRKRTSLGSQSRRREAVGAIAQSEPGGVE